MRKTVKTGVRQWHLEQWNADTIREILKDYRDKLIDAVLTDIQVYILGKHNVSVPFARCIGVRTKLLTLKESNISLVTYGPLIDEILSKEFVNVGPKTFYDEIDRIIVDDLNIAQLSIKQTNSDKLFVAGK